MKLSEYKSYDDLPLFLNAEMVACLRHQSMSSCMRTASRCCG